MDVQTGGADGTQTISFKDCNSTICPYDKSFYQYRIDVVPNAVFLGLFSLSLICFAAVYAVKRRGAIFTLAMIFGLLSEIIGYAGRIMSWQNQWSENGFLMQICCLTLAPAFLAAGVYLCIRRIVFAFGPENSRIPPKLYTRIFIPCDIVSLVLQAAGGGMASVAFHQGNSTDTGDNIMIAGLSFQVFTLLIFMGLSIDFLINTLRRRKALGSEAAFSQDPELIAVRKSIMFKGFLVALAVSTICIFWRSVFRVAELSRGWTGPLMARQDLFIGFEGVLITVAVWVLNIFHPAVSFGPLMDRKFGEETNTGEPKEEYDQFQMMSAGKPDTATSSSDPGDAERHV